MSVLFVNITLLLGIKTIHASDLKGMRIVIS